MAVHRNVLGEGKIGARKSGEKFEAGLKDKVVVTAEGRNRKYKT